MAITASKCLQDSWKGLKKIHRYSRYLTFHVGSLSHLYYNQSSKDNEFLLNSYWKKFVPHTKNSYMPSNNVCPPRLFTR